MTHNNVNPDEIAKFGAHANDWWNLNGSMKLLHQLNPLRLQYIQRYTSLADKSVLDIGCGGGILTESLASQGAAHTTGIDLCEPALAVARSHAISLGLAIDYQTMSAEDYARTHAQQLDVITCMEMLEHVPNPQSIVQACYDALKPGGFAFFSTINRTPKAYLVTILGAEYFLRALPRGTHQYQQFIRPSELDRFASECGFNRINFSGMRYSPFTQRFSLTLDLAVNYLACYQKD